VITRRSRSVVFSSPADLEVAEAALWYEEQRSGLGQRFLAAVRKAADAAARSPQVYAHVHDALRRVLVHRFPYALIFRETHGALVSGLIDLQRAADFPDQEVVDFPVTRYCRDLA
jgi:toxin ParE1/3/4